MARICRWLRRHRGRPRTDEGPGGVTGGDAAEVVAAGRFRAAREGETRQVGARPSRAARTRRAAGHDRRARDRAERHRGTPGRFRRSISPIEWPPTACRNVRSPSAPSSRLRWRGGKRSSVWRQRLTSIPALPLFGQPAKAASDKGLPRLGARFSTENGDKSYTVSDNVASRKTTRPSLTKSIAATRSSGYSESSIRVLKGLEPVRQRPGMYTRTESPLHIVQEVVDNAADEALGGFASTIAVQLDADGGSWSRTTAAASRSASIRTKGSRSSRSSSRGSTPAASSTRAPAAPTASPAGLHGVGVSVTNALSTSLEVTVWRDGGVHTIGFAGGDVSAPLVSRPLDKRDDRGVRSTGTRVTVKPDPEVLRQRGHRAGRPAAPVAQQGGAVARRDGHADRRTCRNPQGRQAGRRRDLALRARPARVSRGRAVARDRRRAADPDLRRASAFGGHRPLRRGRGRRLGGSRGRKKARCCGSRTST